MKKIIISTVVLTSVIGLTWFLTPAQETPKAAESISEKRSISARNNTVDKDTDNGSMTEVVAPVRYEVVDETAQNFTPMSLEQAIAEGMPESGANEEIIDMSAAEYAAPIDMSEEENAAPVDMSDASLAPEIDMQ